MVRAGNAVGVRKASFEPVCWWGPRSCKKTTEEETWGPNGGRGKRKLVETRGVQCRKRKREFQENRYEGHSVKCTENEEEFRSRLWPAASLAAVLSRRVVETAAGRRSKVYITVGSAAKTNFFPTSHWKITVYPPRSWIVGLYGECTFNFKKQPNCFPRWLDHFAFLPVTLESSSDISTWSALGIFSFVFCFLF